MSKTTLRTSRYSPGERTKKDGLFTVILSPSASEVDLPLEIILQILAFIPRRPNYQSTFWACTLISRSWYSQSISILYERPWLHGGNFNEFIATVCPSKNAHIKQSTLATLVRRLDMGELVHNASKSLTARILGRLKGNLEQFVAPQSSFAINSFAALSKCTRLNHLDLSLISASISNKILFQTLKSLQGLETLYFPRSSSLDRLERNVPTESYIWPPRLQALHLAGGIDDYFLHTHLVKAPPTLSRLSIQHCSSVHAPSLLSILQILGPQLKHLTIRHPMTKLFTTSLDDIFYMCPSLIALRISADFISNAIFRTIPANHPLQILDLECSPQAGQDVEIDPSTVYDAVEECLLPDLRSVRVSARLAWNATEKLRLDSTDLLEILEENDMERPLGIEPGVWLNLPD